MRASHGCGAESSSKGGVYIGCRNAQTAQMEMTSPQNADNQCINGLDCDCDHGCEKIHVRCCVLVDAYASHPVLLSVTVSCRSLSSSSTTLNPNQSPSQTMIQTQTRTLDRRQRR